MSVRYWADLKSSDLSPPAAPGCVALLPVGAIEQHGPHLPLGTDMLLAEALARAAAERTRRAEVVLLPVQAWGASEEHHDWPGTVWLPPELLIPTLLAIGRGVARAGIAKLVLLNAHGGNVPALQIVCRRLRVEHGLFVASAGWMAFGLPDAAPDLRRDDIHAGFMETAAMLHLWPDLVDMSRAGDFVPRSRAVAEGNAHLRLLGAVTTGWTARDLHASGAAGNAAGATAEAGARIVAHCAGLYAAFLDEVAAHDPALAPGPA